MVKIARKLEEHGVKHIFGPVVSCDAFYTEEGFVEK